jgi:hypothetical protein
MALLGQASGGFTESSSALRILHVGVRNTVGQLASTAFTQANPVSGAASNTQAPGLLTNVLGVLSGSIAFAHNATTNEHGGALNDGSDFPIGVFINNASGNAFENQPGVASNRGPYVSGQGTYANRLYETHRIDVGNNGTSIMASYVPGAALVASLNGFLTTFQSEVGHDHDTAMVLELATSTAAVQAGLGAIGIVKIAPDSSSDELVYDQRI